MSASDAEGSAQDGPAAGTEIGPYRVVGVIGRGGMGVVLEARHVRVGQRAAVKLLTPARRAAVGDAAVRRFLAEVDALSRLEHPGLVRVLDCGESPEHGPWIAMEYVAGEVLRARLDRALAAGQPVSLAAALRVARRIASAVSAIHQAGIVHRDLKPDNVMVTPDDEVPGGERVKLLDFGIAKLAHGDGRQTTEGVVLGTAGYMAPEQCVGDRDLDDKADVYAVGVILFELIGGLRPFVGSTPEVMRAHIFAEPPYASLPALPDGALELLKAMLAKEATLRPAIGEVVARLRALEAAAGGAPEAEPALAFDDTAPARASTTAPATAVTAAGTRPGGAQSTLAPVIRATVPVARRRRRWPWLAAGVVAAGAVAGVLAFGGKKRAAGAKAAVVAQSGMVVIPGARFSMGSTREALVAACAELPGGCLPEEQPQLDRELPAHPVTVTTFQLDAREVTNREYAAFLDGIGPLIGVRDDADEHYPRFVFEHSTKLDLLDLYKTGGIVRVSDNPDAAFAARPGMEDLPATQMTWDGASRYCHNRGKRLPTEAEWELAARGPEGRRFPWGADAPRCDGVVFGRGDARGCPSVAAALAAVGTAAQDVTAAGVHDLGGNAGEWVEDQFLGPSYADCGACKDPVARDPAIALTDDFRIFRGGTYAGPAWMSRTTTRSRYRRTAALGGLGFRCASR